MTITMTRGRTLLLLLAGLLALPAPRPAAAEELAVYEDWTAPTIRSDRWFGMSELGQERRREVQGHAMHLRFRREGGTLSDVGATGFFSNRLHFRNPLAVQRMEVELKVVDLDVTGCSANATPSITRAATIDLTRINDLPPDIPLPPGDVTGEHIARVEVRRLSDSQDPAGVLTVRALLFRCNDPGCLSSSVIAGPVVLGQIRVHQRARVRLGWNPEGHEFVAGLDDEADVSLPYAPAAHSRPANNPFAVLRIQHLPANCTIAAGGPTVGDAATLIGLVKTNASAVIP